MQILDYSPTAGQAPAQGSLKRLGLVFKYGSELTAEMEAQVAVMDLLGKYLDDRYCLLRNITLPDLEVPIPFILIGPPGVQMIYVTPVKGIYRARGDLWFVVDTRRRFRPAAPNLIIRSTLMARAIQVFLEQRGLPNVKVDPILVSTSPGLYIEAIRPTVRIVMSDAIDRLIAGLQQDPLVLTRPDVETMVNLLTSKAAAETPAAAARSEPAPEPFVPEPVTEETPAWMEDRIAGLDKAAEEVEAAPAEPEPAASEQEAAEARAEWAAEEIQTGGDLAAEPSQGAREPELGETTPLKPQEAVVASLPEPEPSPAGLLEPQAAPEEPAAPLTEFAELLQADAGEISLEEASGPGQPKAGFTGGQRLVLGLLVLGILLVAAVFVYLLLTSG